MEQLQIQAKLPGSDEWVYLDLFENEIFQIAYEANPIGKLSERNAIRSSKITIPKTPTNNRVMGLVDDINSWHDVPSEGVPCKVVFKGMEVLVDGFFVLIESAVNHYEIIIRSGLSDLFNTMADIPLRETDPRGHFNAVVPWSVQGIINNAEKPTCIPIIDWNVEDNPTTLGDGDGQESPWIQARTLYPAVKISALFRAVIESNGYALSSDIFNDERFLNSALCCVSGRISPLEESDWKGSYKQNVPTVRLDPSNRIYKFDNGVIEGMYPDDPYKLLRHRLTLGKYYYRIEATTNSKEGIWIHVKEGQKVVHKRFISNSSSNKTTTHDFMYEALTNENLSFEISLSGVDDDNYANINELSIECVNYEAIDEDMFPNLRFNVVQNLPDISQLDFVKEVLLMFGLMIDVDAGQKEVFCYNWNTIYAQAYNKNAQARPEGNPKFYNWSKYALNHPNESVSYGYSLDQSQENELKYKETEYTNEHDKSVKVTSEALLLSKSRILKKGRTTLFEFKSTACEEVMRFNRQDGSEEPLKLAKIRYRKNAQAVSDSPMHIVYLKNDYNTKLDLRGDTTKTEVTGLAYATFEQISAPKLADKYYSRLFDGILRRTRVYNEYFILPTDVVANFKHRHPVYVGKYDRWFFVNRLEYRGGIAIAELILLSLVEIDGVGQHLPPRIKYEMEILERPE